MSDPTVADGPPVRSHRRSMLPSGPLGTAVRRTGQAVAILVALWIGAQITTHTPDADAQQAPFVRTAAIGQQVDARTFTVTVLGVRGGAKLSDDSGAHDTSGVWFLVRMRLTAQTNPVAIGYAALLDAHGRTYRATARIDQPMLDGRLLEPGIPITTEMAFEVPTGVATGVSIQLAVSDDDQRMDTMARVRLPVTTSQIRAWRATSTPLTLAPIVVS